MASASQSSPFRLLPWFAAISAVVIALIAIGNAWVVSRFLTDQFLEREAVVSRDFVQNVLLSDGSLDYLRHPENPAAQLRFQESLQHLSNMRDMLRANVYGRDQQLLWSTVPALIGRHFSENTELEQALRGELVVHSGRIDADARAKKEHEGLPDAAAYFVETYIPILASDGQTVLGVIELYKVPLPLTEAIEKGQRQVAWAALVGALLLYLSLFGLVRRADQTIRAQHGQLVEAETMAVIGELASSVAHNIRNPLASIRSSAELSLECMAEHGEESARDIVREVDRISTRITQLLNLAHHAPSAQEPVALAPLVQGCLDDYRDTFVRRGQSLQAGTLDAASVLADAELLRQVLGSVLANASEAMPGGGECHVQLDASDRQQICIRVVDEGRGIAPEARHQLFRPFFTTKPQGLGLGLPLARRILQRFGGTIAIQPGAPRGAVVLLTLPKA
ncbi:MAG: ATP-binding protein [Burkholderiaceae bacterium]|nr:ATP-binding protein [Burkholderiaceae bacterium]